MKACTQLTFAASADAVSDNNVGVTAFAKVESNSDSGWYVYTIFCCNRVDLDDIRIYVKRTVTSKGSSGGGYSEGSTFPATINSTLTNGVTYAAGWDEVALSGIGSTKEEVIIINGEGPWKVQHPVATGNPPSMSGACRFAATKVKSVHISDEEYVYHDDYYHFVEIDRKGVITLKKGIKTASGVVEVEYKVGGSMLYFPDREYFFSSAYTFSSITGGQWEYIAVSDSAGVLGTGTVSPSGQTEVNDDNVNEVWGPIPAWVE